MKLAFVFSGQGAQYVGMGKELYEKYPTVRKRFDEAERFLSYKILPIMFADKEKINETRYSQPAIFTMSAALRDLMQEEGIDNAGSCGLSLGEYVAYYDNGVYNFYDGVQLVEHRAFFMEQAVRENPGKMYAVASDANSVKKALKEHEGVFIANVNHLKQTVVAGQSDAVDMFAQKAKDYGFRRMRPLKTSGAFHTPLMRPAADHLSMYLKLLQVEKPKKELYLNTTGNRYDGEDLKENMVAHMIEPVLFQPMIERMKEDGYDTFVELGPGGVLKSLIRKIYPEATLFHVEDAESLEHTIAALKGEGNHE